MATAEQDVLLKAEIDTDPLVRGYAPMSDDDVAIDMRLVIRPGQSDPLALLEYLTLERFRQGNLYGRIAMVANSLPVKDGNSWTIPPLPIGVADADVTLTQQHIAAALTFLRFVQFDVETVVTLIDSRIETILDDLGPGGAGCGAIGGADKTAIQALSTDKQDRGTEIEFGRVLEGDVIRVRALP